MAKASQQRAQILTRTSTSGGTPIAKQPPGERSTDSDPPQKQLKAGLSIDHMSHVHTLRPSHSDHRSHMHHQFHSRANIPTYLDDFKQGLPKKGLATVSNQWWGSEQKEGLTLGQVQEEDSSLWEDGEAGIRRFKVGTKGSHKEERRLEDVLPATTLVRTRRKAAIRGRKVQHLAGTRGYGPFRLAEKDGALLRAVFDDALPDLWKAYLAT